MIETSQEFSVLLQQRATTLDYIINHTLIVTFIILLSLTKNHQNGMNDALLLFGSLGQVWEYDLERG